MLRIIIFIVLLIIVLRAARLLWRGLTEGMSGPPAPNVPQRSVQMVRDPVCGTFLLPERAVTISVGHQQLHFCSATCRDKYRARTA